MTPRDSDAVVQASIVAAANIQRIGCDGIELHGPHGYLIDNFLWAAPTGAPTATAATTPRVPASPPRAWPRSAIEPGRRPGP
ncbi:hypothetical protein [Streptomyces albospinus]|nr:hypothetical protein [Streptomyces albospinus]